MASERQRPQGRRTVIKAALVVLALVGLLATLAAVQILNEGQRTARYHQALETSISERSHIRAIFSALQNAETGQRGFILTGDPEFLEPYEQALRILPEEMGALFSLLDDEVQRARATELQDLAETRLRELRRGIETSRELRLGAAIDVVRSKRGERAMGRIRELVSEMLTAEEQTIEQQYVAARRQSAASQGTALALLFAIVFLVVSASVLGMAYLEHRRRTEQGLREAMQLAEHASEAKTEFLASMSHEIRTPLTGILGYTELLSDEGLAPEQHRYLERIQVAGTSLLTIVDDILDFSKIEAGEIKLDPQPFSMRSLVDNLVSIVSIAARKKRLPISIAVDPGLPPVLVGDEPRLRQILLNLLNNAIKFTQEGHISLRVQHEGSSVEGEMVRILVSDTGIGIPLDKRDRLFRRFSQLDPSIRREFGGTGLGLAISKRLVELMGGRIGFEPNSESGEHGTTFWITLTLPQGEASEDTETHAENLGLGLAGRILLAEDLEQNQALVRAMLTAAGHEVDVVSNGAEAVAAVQEFAYDLVLMDVQMPGMDGLTATRVIRSLDHPASEVPIVALTANVLPRQLSSFRTAGMNDHIGKPFKRAQLLEKTEAWLSRSRKHNGAGYDIPPSGENDTEAFEELRALMGDKWAREGLAKLKDQIADAFGNPSNDHDPAKLARKSHDLVSHAAMFGFRELSRRCMELEEACLSTGDYAPTLEVARKEAQGAERRIGQMLQDERIAG